MTKPLDFGRIVDNVGGVNGVSERTDVQEGIVQIAAKLNKIEQGKANSILQNSEVSALLGGQFIGVELSEAMIEILVESTLMIDGGRAKVVQLFVEHLTFVFVQPRGCGSGWRKREN